MLAVSVDGVVVVPHYWDVVVVPNYYEGVAFLEGVELVVLWLGLLLLW